MKGLKSNANLGSRSMWVPNDLVVELIEVDKVGRDSLGLF